MATILDTISEATRARVRAQRRRPLESPGCRCARAGLIARRFEAALKRPELSFICEVKKASPGARGNGSSTLNFAIWTLRAAIRKRVPIA